MTQLDMRVLENKMFDVLAYLRSCNITSIEYVSPDKWKIKLDAPKEARS